MLLVSICMWFFEEKYYEEYENILCLIRNELKLYDMNLAYCKKIVDFLTNEFEKKGIYEYKISE